MGFLRAYRFPLILLAAIALGSVIGFMLGPKSAVLKPLGDIFLNLMFVIVVPLVFVTISSTIANMSSLKRLGKIMGWMLLIFVITGIRLRRHRGQHVGLPFHRREGMDEKRLERKCVETTALPKASES